MKTAQLNVTAGCKQHPALFSVCAASSCTVCHNTNLHLCNSKTSWVQYEGLFVKVNWGTAGAALFGVTTRERNEIVRLCVNLQFLLQAHVCLLTSHTPSKKNIIICMRNVKIYFKWPCKDQVSVVRSWQAECMNRKRKLNFMWLVSQASQCTCLPTGSWYYWVCGLKSIFLSLRVVLQ